MRVSGSKEVLLLETLPEDEANKRGCESDEGANSDEVILEDEPMQYDTRL